MTNRHELIARALKQHAAGQLTDLELAARLAWVVDNHPCDCMACTD